MLPLSTEASATLVHNYKLVIKTSAVTSPKQRWSPQVTQQQHHQYRAPLVPKQQHHQYRAPLVEATTPPSPARPDVPILDRRLSERTNQDSHAYDIRQYFPGIADSAT
jgi:hypothetical protein